jgi:hypothetical protein
VDTTKEYRRVRGEGEKQKRGELLLDSTGIDWLPLYKAIYLMYQG